MGKIKKAFFCQNCGAQSPKWVGKCNSCNEWNTYVEEIIEKESPQRAYAGVKSIPKVFAIQDIVKQKTVRYKTPEKEFNRVLGGGLVPGSISLFGGEPGIGKSTLLLQLALKWNGIKLLYVSGEESSQQIKMRADRIGFSNRECLILAETNLENILLQIEQHQPDILIIDSIQTLYSKSIESASGSISQIRECASQLMRFAKETNTPVFLI
ncbi:MAG: DNA repair protein RadA, partial [Verrucomicrobia bacterium]|nr:DNA repair protein RadA [Verrucomicrobiota bacterium]